ncbi:LysR family transcriptional regulator [Paenirhodobacter sp.]|uniref:LysR family transcriptional regulator n=1 Tax=Paenirhodobacter sp. TaxID=1965326 RepID=UPI003B421890
MQFDNWDEIRTAFQVAKVGTVSGAAEVLGVHHATVIRHVDALEERMGTKLFQRHPRGYTPTEAGMQLLAVGQATEDQFAQLAARISGSGEEISGELIITAPPTIGSLLAPAFTMLLEDHPGLRLHFLTDLRVFRLEYGEAHVAIRAGTKPTEPDNVVQSLGHSRVGLYASQGYIDRHGLPSGIEDLPRHRFIGSESRETRARFYRWLAETVPEESVVYSTNSLEGVAVAVRAGVGIGFMPVVEGRHRGDLVEVMDPLPDWEAPLWLVTHVDLHRTPKVQAALKAIKSAVLGQGEGV